MADRENTTTHTTTTYHEAESFPPNEKNVKTVGANEPRLPPWVLLHLIILIGLALLLVASGTVITGIYLVQSTSHVLENVVLNSAVPWVERAGGVAFISLVLMIGSLIAAVIQLILREAVSAILDRRS